MNAWALKLIFFMLNIKWVRIEIFSVTVEIESLIRTRGYVINTIEQYLKREEHRIKVLNTYLNQFINEQEKMARDDTYAFNPINAYSLIHTLTEDLFLISDHIETDPTDQELEIPDDLLFPLEDDLTEAAVALGRLQKTYALNVTLLAAGKLTGTYSHGNKFYTEDTSPLSMSATFHVGRELYLNGYYEASLHWLHEALNKYYRNDQQNPYCYDDSFIIDYIRNAYYGIHDYKNAIHWTRILMQLMPLDDELYESMVFYHNELKKNETEVILPESPSDEVTSLTGLCQGDMQVPEEKKKDLASVPINTNPKVWSFIRNIKDHTFGLHCHYKSGPHPYLRLAPIKTELLYRDPDVYLFYDTITDAECELLRWAAQSKLRRATVVSGRNMETRIDSSRTSKIGWLFGSDWPVVDRLSRRVTTFTGLSMETAEPLQVANYGIGGHYAAHYDFLEEVANKTAGDRIATVLFYMSEVELGGATVFLHLNLTVFPVKNAALFWSNLLPSGEPDFRMLHAACPVLRGSKWACNQWIHAFGQQLIVPCGLEYQKNFKPELLIRSPLAD